MTWSNFILRNIVQLYKNHVLTINIFKENKLSLKKINKKKNHIIIKIFYCLTAIVPSSYQKGKSETYNKK